MKYIFYITAFIATLLLASCEKVVDVDLDTAAPRLVVDARLNWQKGTAGNEQTIRLTTTAPYYNNAVPAVNGATVFVTNDAGTIFTFSEVGTTGYYTCLDFVPVINGHYTLTVIYGGQTYTADETLYATPVISEVVQRADGGFLGENIEVKFFFQDNPLQDNFYLVRFDTPVLPYPDYDVLDDEFFQGNEMFDFIDNEDFAAGQPLGLNLYGISERYYNYMSQLISIAEGGAGSGPFQSPPANVTGNIINTTNPGNTALGYFSLSEMDKVNYVIQ